MKKQTILIMLIFSLLIFLSRDTLGKYFSKTNIEVNSEIAKPILKIEGDEILDISNLKEKETYKFKVKNYDEGNQITQTNLEYYIEIISETNENIDFKIYKEDKELNIDGNKTEKNLLSKEEKQEDNYKIEILFKNISVQEIIQNVEIKVYSEQKN